MLSKENKLLMMAEVSASQKIESWLQDQANDEHQRSAQSAEALARARGR